MVRRTIILLPLTMAILAGGGCASIRVTDPYSTATEQFLLSEACRQAIAKISVDAMRDRKVFVDASYLTGGKQTSPGNLVATRPPPNEDLFALGEIRSRLLNNGVRLVDNVEEADIIMEVRSGGIGIDRTDFLLGLPGMSLSVDVVANVPVQTPELSILKNTKQHGFASIAYVAYWRDTGEVVASSGPFIGRTAREDFWIFGAGPWTGGNIAPAQPAPPTTQSSQ